MEFDLNGTMLIVLFQTPQYISMMDFLRNGYVLALITLGAMLLQGTFLQNSFYLSVRQGIRCKAAIQVK